MYVCMYGMRTCLMYVCLYLCSNCMTGVVIQLRIIYVRLYPMVGHPHNDPLSPLLEPCSYDDYYFFLVVT